MHFSFEHNGAWLHLGRYFDPWYDKENPETLAKSLGMQIDEVFPVAYGLRPYVASESPIVTGAIPKNRPNAYRNGSCGPLNVEEASVAEFA